MNKNIIPIFLGLVFCCMFYLGLSNPLIDEPKPTEEYLEFIWNKPELSAGIAEEFCSECGLSDEKFVEYVHKYIKKWDIKVVKIKYFSVNKFASKKWRCIYLAVIYMKEPMAVYRANKNKE